MRLELNFRDEDRGLEYEALVAGEYRPASRDTLDDYNGSTPGETAAFDATALDVHRVTILGMNNKSESGLMFAPSDAREGTIANCRGWNLEVLDDCREAIEQAALEQVEGRRVEVES